MAKDHHLRVGRITGELTALRQLLLHPSLDTAFVVEDGLVWDGAAWTGNSDEIVVRAGPQYFLPLLGMDGNIAKTIDVCAKASIVAVAFEVLSKEKALE